MTRGRSATGALLLLVAAAAAAFASDANGAGIRTFDVPVGGWLTSLHVVDVTGDRQPDVVIGNVDGSEGEVGRVVVAAGDGRGGFGAPRVARTLEALASTAVGDMTGDGTAEVVTVDGYELVVRSAAADGALRPLSTARGGFEDATGLAVGDVTADGHADLVVAGWSADAWQLLAGDGTGSLSGTEATFARTALGSGVALADVDRDGRLDAVSGETVLRNAGAGRWPVVSRHPDANDVVAVDVDGDAAPDLVSAAEDHDLSEVVVLVHRNDGAGRMRLVSSWTDPRGFQDLDVGDVDGDGRVDVVVAHGGVDVRHLRPDVRALSVLFGDGRGGFARQIRVRLPFHRDKRTGGAPTAVAVADVDANGRRDLLAVGRSPRAGRLAIVLNPSLAALVTGVRVTPRRLVPGRRAEVALTLGRRAHVAVELHGEFGTVRLAERDLSAGTHVLRVTAPRKVGGRPIASGPATLVVEARAGDLESPSTLPVELRRAHARGG